MQFLNTEELYSAWQHESNHSLWKFLESENSNFISNAEKAEIKNWVNKINYQHHNDRNFFSNLKEIFTENEICYVMEGQEDKAAIALNNSVVIVRNSEGGVGFNLIQLDGNKINQENWVNFNKILNNLKLGFINAKDFHLQRSFDIMNSELGIKDSTKDRKVKI